MKTILFIITIALFTFCAIRFYNNGYSFYLKQPIQASVYVDLPEEPVSQGDTLQVLSIKHGVSDTIYIGYYHAQ